MPLSLQYRRILMVLNPLLKSLCLIKQSVIDKRTNSLMFQFFLPFFAKEVVHIKTWTQEMCVVFQQKYISSQLWSYLWVIAGVWCVTSAFWPVIAFWIEWWKVSCQSSSVSFLFVFLPRKFTNWSVIPLLWTSGDFSSGYQSHTSSSPACHGFLRFTSGATPADLLAASMAAKPLWVTYIMLTYLFHDISSFPIFSRNRAYKNLCANICNEVKN